jgi:hypothetical protein
VFDVEVCDVESVFIHVTVVPTVMLNSPGTKARFPRNSAPTGITTDVVEPVGVGVGDDTGGGDGEVGDDEELSPQAMANTKIVEMTAKRNDNMRASEMMGRNEFLGLRVAPVLTRTSNRLTPAKIPGWCAEAWLSAGAASQHAVDVLHQRID